MRFIDDVAQLTEQLSEWRSEDLDNPLLFLNRELSLLSFNQRVMALACDPRIPLLERLRFLCISCTNLDEFFEVRVASIRQRMQHGINQASPDGLSPAQTLAVIRQTVCDMITEQYRILNDELTPELREQDIRILRRSRWSADQRQWLYEHFQSEIMPVLSPLGLDPAHPFPRILNKSLNFAVALDGDDAFSRDSGMALVRAPRSLPRIIRIPQAHSEGPNDFVFLSSVMHAFIHELFPGMHVKGCYQFRVTRNSELFVDQEEVEDLARALEGELMARGFAEPVRLEVASNCPDDISQFLALQFGLDEDDIYRCDGPVNLNRMSAVYDLADRADLCFSPFQPATPRALMTQDNLFAAIERQDWMLHHPYDSFTPIVDLMRQAVNDPAVLAIKQTLYRTGVDSALVGLLIEAARAGKDVTAIVELRARFDEEANIALAMRMQEAGVQVVYGVVGHKTHAKLMLIVRREQNQLKRYAHLGSGNYHQGTAKAYTDWSLLTANEQITEDVHRIFQQLSGLGQVQPLHHVLQSPFNLHTQLLSKIEREIAHANDNRPSGIDAKMNGLTEPSIIQALYRASRAGVPIRLVVRGICCLRPGVPGLSENIEVRSILGRFLEHSRVYHFVNGGETETMVSSADWMERNLFQRIEACFPILDETLAKHVREESIDLAFEDNQTAWVLGADGHYRRVTKEENIDAPNLHNQLISRHCDV
jgi:polyphosphate kinase